MKETAICVVDDQRRIVREGKAATDPESISALLSVTGVHRIGHPAHCPFAAGAGRSSDGQKTSLEFRRQHPERSHHNPLRLLLPDRPSQQPWRSALA